MLRQPEKLAMAPRKLIVYRDKYQCLMLIATISARAK